MIKLVRLKLWTILDECAAVVTATIIFVILQSDWFCNPCLDTTAGKSNLWMNGWDERVNDLNDLDGWIR